jgi:AcrR family transcriptional regulator
MARERATDTTALVAAAAEVFRIRGYHNATIDDIAEAAGISRPTVYKYTKSKQHLLDLMVDQVTQDMGRRMQAVIHSTDDPTERLRRVVRAHVEAAVANRTFYAIVLSEEVEVSVTAEFQELVEECLRAQRNPPKVDPFIVANLVLSMLTSLYRWYDPTGPASPERLTDEILLVIGNLLP